MIYLDKHMLRVYLMKQIQSFQAEMLRELQLLVKHLTLLKLVWDHATLVHYTFESWQATPWAKVDCDGCFMHCKRLQQAFVLLERKQKAISRGLAVVQKGGLKTKKSRERTEKLKVLKELW